MQPQGLEELSFGTVSALDVLGTELEFFQAGGGPPLLFLHGLDGIEGAAPLQRELAKNFTVYAPSHPGFGASAGSPRISLRKKPSRRLMPYSTKAFMQQSICVHPSQFR